MIPSGVSRTDDILSIIDLLITTPRSEVVTFEMASNRIGKDVRVRYRHILERAIRLAEREHQAVFENIRNIGYVRMVNGKVEPFCKKSTQQVRSLSKRRSKTIGAFIAGSNDLPNASKIACLVTQGKLGVIAHLCRESIRPNLPNNSDKPPSVSETSRMLLEHIGAKSIRRTA